MEQFSGKLANSFGAFSLQPVITEHDSHACPPLLHREQRGTRTFLWFLSRSHTGRGGSSTVVGQRVGQVRGVNPIGLGDMCDHHSSVIIHPLKHNAVIARELCTRTGNFSFKMGIYLTTRSCTLLYINELTNSEKCQVIPSVGALTFPRGLIATATPQ